MSEIGPDYIEYKSYKIRPISIFSSNRNGWLPIARMSHNLGMSEFIFTVTGESVFPTKAMADSHAMELAREWVDNRPSGG